MHDRPMFGKEGFLKVRWYRESDLARLAEIHAECYPHEHWEPADFRRFVAKSTRRNRLKVLANDETGEVCGTLLYTLTAAECAVRRVAVPAACRRQGYATYLVYSLTGPQSPVVKEAYTARVRGDCLAGLLFLRDSRLGFTFDAGRRHRYRDGMDGYHFRICRNPAAAAGAAELAERAC